MSGFTPGPWWVDPDYYRDVQGGGFEISTAFARSDLKGVFRIEGKKLPTKKQAKANARLIAAAPDLLEALTEARGVLRDYIAAAGPIDGADSRLLARIAAAIAKATGEAK